MQVTMKLPPQSTTARQFKVFLISWSEAFVSLEMTFLLARKDAISQKAFSEQIVRDLTIIKEESEQDVTLISDKFIFFHVESCWVLSSCIGMFLSTTF